MGQKEYQITVAYNSALHAEHPQFPNATQGHAKP